MSLVSMMQQYLCGCGNFINFSLCAVTFVFVPTCPPSTSVLFLEYDKTKYRFMLLYICELDLKESSHISVFFLLTTILSSLELLRMKRTPAETIMTRTGTRMERRTSRLAPGTSRWVITGASGDSEDWYFTNVCFTLRRALYPWNNGKEVPR